MSLLKSRGSDEGTFPPEQTSVIPVPVPGIGALYSWQVLINTEYTYSWKNVTKKLAINVGVPVWKETLVINDDDTTILHFGEIPKNPDDDLDKTTDWSVYSGNVDSTRSLFHNKFNFFTYNPTQDGVGDFQFPFSYTAGQGKGVLSNWWAGCEPTCDVLAKLLKDGIFYGNGIPDEGFAFLFRKGVKRLVFVFSNEFDNSMTRDTKGNVHEVQVVPSIESGTLSFSVNPVTETIDKDKYQK